MSKLINLSQSGASEFLITEQVEEAIKQKPDLIIIGHTSEYRWQVRDKRTGWSSPVATLFMKRPSSGS